MSEYSDSTSVNKILGSSPGYVGYDDNRNVLEEIRNKPNSVLLLDEIDKAHPSVINLFYQILEDGKIKNSNGICVNFNNVIIIMTSNATFDSSKIGFNKLGNSACLGNLKNYFNTAFVNRIDNIVVFNNLSYEDIKLITNNKLNSLKSKYDKVDIVYGDATINYIVDKSNYIEFGARRIDKVISNSFESFIIDSIISNTSNINLDEYIEKEKISL